MGQGIFFALITGCGQPDIPSAPAKQARTMQPAVVPDLSLFKPQPIGAEIGRPSWIAHANAAEHLPIALLLLLLLDLGQTPPSWLHVFGVLLIVGRVLHAIGLSRTAGPSPGRVLGMVLTWGVMLAMALLLLWKAAMY